MKTTNQRVPMFAFESNRRYGKTDQEPEFYCVKCKKTHTKNTKLKKVEVLDIRAYCSMCGWVSV